MVSGGFTSCSHQTVLFTFVSSDLKPFSFSFSPISLPHICLSFWLLLWAKPWTGSLGAFKYLSKLPKEIDL